MSIATMKGGGGLQQPRGNETLFGLVLLLFVFVTFHSIVLKEYSIDLEFTPQGTHNNNTTFNQTRGIRQYWNEIQTISSTIMMPQEEEEEVEKLIKTVSYGNHTRIPSPDTRIGPKKEQAYIHDPTYINSHPRPMKVNTYVCAPPGQGPEEPTGQEALDRIRDHITSIHHSIPRNKKKPSVFCAVYTYDKAVNWTDAIWETWGQRCDGILFASTMSNLTTGHTHIPHNSRYEGGYKGMWQKVRSMQAYIYDNFLNDYDYYHFSGDDTYLIVDNLKEFLGSESVQQYQATNHGFFYSGFWIHQDRKDLFTPIGNETESNFVYMGGGSGYTMSKYVIKAFVENVLGNCLVTKEGSSEDVNMALCLRMYLNITGYDSRDQVGAHRYHQLTIERHANFPQKRYGYSTLFIRKAMGKMERHYGFPVVYQQAYISNSTIAFHKHYFPDRLRRYDYLLYGSGKEQCQDLMLNASLSNASLTS